MCYIEYTESIKWFLRIKTNTKGVSGTKKWFWDYGLQFISSVIGCTLGVLIARALLN